MMTKERIFDVLRQLQRQCGVPPDDLEAAAHMRNAATVFYMEFQLGEAGDSLNAELLQEARDCVGILEDAGSLGPKDHYGTALARCIAAIDAYNAAMKGDEE